MHANAASKLASVVETDLNRRFAILSLKLQARSGAASGLTSTSGQASLSSYLPQHTRPPASAAAAVDVQDVFRALSRVDMARKPAQVGDAARRAAREVQRAQEGGHAFGERRLTGVAPPTPRKPPGTPRRATTPARGR